MMSLENEEGTIIADPNDDDIVEQLEGLLCPENQYSTLTNRRLFIQALIEEEGDYVIEYSDGAPDKMFQYYPATLDEVKSAFLLFRNGGDYRAALPFEPMDIGAG
jgi:hypothetical protein